MEIACRTRAWKPVYIGNAGRAHQINYADCLWEGGEEQKYNTPLRHYQKQIIVASIFSDSMQTRSLMPSSPSIRFPPSAHWNRFGLNYGWLWTVAFLQRPKSATAVVSQPLVIEWWDWWWLMRALINFVWARDTVWAFRDMLLEWLIQRSSQVSSWLG